MLRARRDDVLVIRDDVLVILAAALPLVLFVLRERAVAGASGFPLDDSWIHLHFARNIAEGAGFSYNPGSPVAGSTAPLWTLLLAGAVLVAGASTWTAKALGVACTVAAALVTRRLVLTLGASPAAAVAAAVALVWAGPIVWGALSGMEVSLAALLVALALLAHAQERSAWTASLAALAVLARPESAILLPLLAVARPLSVRRVALFVGVAAVVVAPAVWFSLATAGSPVPATAAAKVEGGLLGWWSGVREPLPTALLARPWDFAREWVRWLWHTHWALPLMLVPALVLAFRHGGRRWAWPALALALHPVAMAVLAPYRGPSFQEGRYSIHLLPLAIAVAWGFGGRAVRELATGSGVGWLGGRATRSGVGWLGEWATRSGVWGSRDRAAHSGVRWLGGRAMRSALGWLGGWATRFPSSAGAPKWPPHSPSVVPTSSASVPASPASVPTGSASVPTGSGSWIWGVGVALYFVVALWLLWPASARYAWGVQNINAMQVHLGEWVAAHTPPGARLALNDIGAIAFVSRREVIDLMGLVTPEIRPYRRQGEDGVIRYLADACPDYLIIFPAWFPRLASLASRYEVVYRVRLAHNEVAGADEMVVYRALRCAV